MIETPTVLILGAGASIPYGFPSGKELVGKVVGGLNSTTTEFFQALRACNIAPNPQDLSKFSEALLFSQRLSVDAFLEYRTDFL
ncbi:MAG TPA: hypothetical protein VLT36_06985, partial [Candidatus Dormibacteraeota bacterium]|nr:hypothetical protein [Candidatus Dormibacteraeota bacterium]